MERKSCGSRTFLCPMMELILNLRLSSWVVSFAPLIFEKIQNKDGNLTCFLTGRCFVYIEVPASPLERSVKVGGFTARLYHKESPRKRGNLRSAPSVCSQVTGSVTATTTSRAWCVTRADTSMGMQHALPFLKQVSVGSSQRW